MFGCPGVQNPDSGFAELFSCGRLPDGQARAGAKDVHEEVFLNTEGTEFFQSETQSVQQDERQD